MELRHLRAFVAVASKRHFGRAAAGLNLTQPALSLRIQALEKELGVQLLDRNAREVLLTAAGEVLLPYAKSLIEVEDNALADIKQHAAANAGRLAISYLTLWDGLPTRIVSTYKLRYPAVTVDTTSGYSQLNLGRVLKREVDLAFLTMGLENHEAVSIRAIERQEIVLVMAPTHRLAAWDSVPVRQLRREPFIALSSDVNNAIATATIVWLARHLGEEPNVVAREPPDQMAGAVAHRGSAVTLLTEKRASAAAGIGVVYRQLEPRPMLEYGVAYRTDEHSPALAHLLEIVDELAGRLPRQLPAGYEIMSAAAEGGAQEGTPDPASSVA